MDQIGLDGMIEVPDASPPRIGPERLLLTVEEAAERLGIGRTKMFELVRLGEVESVPVGRLRRVPTECLSEFVERLRSRCAHRDPAA